MTDRILDLSEEPAFLKLRLNNIIVEREDMDPVSIHLPEVAAIIASNRRVVFTQSVLAGVAVLVFTGFGEPAPHPEPVEPAEP